MIKKKTTNQQNDVHNGSFVPTRMCVSCRKRSNKSSFLRLVNDDGKLVVDKEQKINKRAFYVCKDLACVKKILKHKAYARLVNENLEDFLKEVESLIN